VEILEDRTLLSFIVAPTYAVGASSVAVADFNGDGHADLVVTEGNTVSVLLAKRDGTFQAPQSYTLSQYGANSVAVGDFNGDGHLDLVVAGYGEDLKGTLSVLLGNGDGTFQAAQSFATRFHFFSVAVGDFNGDGSSDLAFVDEAGGTLSILLGKRDGTFQEPDSYRAGSGPSSVAVGDFDGDGHLDLAVTNARDGTVGIYLGKGDGTFQNAHSSLVGGSPTSVAVGDFNRDGHLDLVVTGNADIGEGTVSILAGNGDGTFQAAQSYGGLGSFDVGVAVGDFNGDGKLDLAVFAAVGSIFPGDQPGALSILIGNGDGTFQHGPSYAPGFRPVSVAVGDLDGDGHLDLAVVNENYFDPGNVSVLLGNGDGTFKAAPCYLVGSGPTSVAVGDFNGDGHPDLAVANYHGVTVLLAEGAGTFRPLDSSVVNSNSNLSLAVGDFNGDGHLDLVVAGYGEDLKGTLSVLLGNGDGTFQAAQSYAAGLRTDLVAVGDFNGHPDLIVANQGDAYGNGSAVSILLGNGDGNFQAPQMYLTGFHASSFVVGDFNGDGHSDLIVADATGGTLSVLLGNGDGTFQSPESYAIGVHPSSVVMGDFNGDGHLDLALANGIYPDNQGTVSILLGNGDGTFQAAQSHVFDSYPSLVVAGDFDRDGHLDLAVANFYGGTVSILLGKGDGTFQTAQNYDASYPSSVAVGDFNGDGFPDLAITTASGVTVLLNAADWGGGAARAVPPRRSALDRAATHTQAESVGIVLAMSKTHDEHPFLSLTTLQPSDMPQSPLEMERVQPDHASRPMLSVRLAHDALFERWNDGILDVLVWTCESA
jgi:hypothetical protein